MNNQKKEDNKVGLGKTLLWTSSATSVGITALLLMQISFYCTDVLQMPAALVGTIFLFSKLFDAVTDVVAGFIIDRTKTKWGKGRPYEIFMIFLWLSTWLLFSCPPHFGMTAKSIWVFFMYTFMNAVCVTFLDGNNVVYMIRAFKTKEQQAKVTAFSSFFTMAAAMIFNILFPAAMAKAGTSPANWSRLVGSLAIPLTFVGILRMLTIKEQYNNEADVSHEKLHIKDVLILAKENRHAVILLIASLLISLVTGMGVTTYYWSHIIGDLSMMGIASLGTILGVPLAFVMPMMRRKMGMKGMCVSGMIFSGVGYFLMFIANDNVGLVILATVMSTVGLVPWNMMFPMFVVDLADYNESKCISRMEGTMGATFGFARKAGSALGGFILGILLQIGGFISGAQQQSGAALMTIRISAGIVPLVAIVVVGLMMQRYTLDKDLLTIHDVED